MDVRFRSTFDDTLINEITDTAEHVTTAVTESIDIESEQDWLGGLYQFVTKVSGGELFSEVSQSSAGFVETQLEDKLEGDGAPLETPIRRESTVTQSKRSSVKTVTTASSDNVGDFFKNLLQAPLKK